VAAKAGGLAIVMVVVEEHPKESVAIIVCVPEHKPVAVQGEEAGTLLQVIAGLTHCIVYGGALLPEAWAVPVALQEL
jgi:hypothetical protein